MKFPRSVVVALVVGVSLGACDMYLTFTRTATMAPVSFPRLGLSLVFQSIGVLGVSSLALSSTSRVRKIFNAWFIGGAFFPAIFGILMGLSLASDALHYSNCLRVDLIRGSCTPYP
jgi:hypothetical protein